jgi:hypothetical protein
MPNGNNSSGTFSPIIWAVAVVIIIVFGAVAYRIATSCEEGTFTLQKLFEVSLKGCSNPFDALSVQPSVPYTPASSITISSPASSLTIYLPASNAIPSTSVPPAHNRYEYPGGSFERNGINWYERKETSQNIYATFAELHRDNTYVFLIDRTRHMEGDAKNFFNLRLPIAGGTAQWSWQNPIVWVDLYVVGPR